MSTVDAAGWLPAGRVLSAEVKGSRRAGTAAGSSNLARVDDEAR
jgi:hypothetical protein